MFRGPLDKEAYATISIQLVELIMPSMKHTLNRSTCKNVCFLCMPSTIAGLAVAPLSQSHKGS